MKTFLAVYLGSPAAMAQWNALDDATKKAREKAGMQGWMKWANDNAGAIVGAGGPLGKTKRINARGIADIRNELAAFTVVQAESHEAAAKLFLNHPHFMLFPGDSVEVMEILPIPT